MFDLIFNDVAEDDIDAAFLWYELQQTGLGYKSEYMLEKGLKTIRRNPFAFQIKYDSFSVHFPMVCIIPLKAIL